MSPPELRLRKHEERRLRAGHLWVYSNEVDVQATPLSAFSPGDPAVITDHGGRPLGIGYVNPNSLICARLVSRSPEQALDKSLLVHRLNVALSLRQGLFEHPAYRLVYGESDALPGLVVDRFGDVLVAQITTAGMDRLKDAVVAALEQVLRPRAVLWRNDSPMRAMEGLETYVAPALGEVPEQVVLHENGAAFEVPLLTGQKTGWYFDHRLNRARACAYARGRRVLDVFSYIGAWGVQAAVAGARDVLCVDDSERALEGVHANAARNGVTEQVATLQGDAFEALKALRAERERFDLVILDPPAFIKRRKDIKEGELAYRRLNQQAMQLLGKDGVLVSASCSYHFERERLKEVLHQSARHLDRRLQILEQGHQGPDHPVHPAMPETDYLKAYVARLVLD